MTIQPNTPFLIEFLGTPEAGKTSLIRRLREELSESFSVSVVQESAEKAPHILPKGSMEAHLWMQYQTINDLLVAQYSTNFDIILIDRGIIDSILWNRYYYSIGKISDEVFNFSNTLFENSFVQFPNQVYYLTTSPEEAIKRRGGTEGRIVTLDFVRRFNSVVDSFMQNYTYPFYKLDTTDLTKAEKFFAIYEHLSNVLNLS